MNWLLSYLWQKKYLIYRKNSRDSTVQNFRVTNLYELSFSGEEPTRYERCCLYSSIVYFCIINCFFLSQPIYLLYKAITEEEHIRQYVGFLCLYLLPTVNYFWLKYYLTTNHLKLSINNYTNYRIKYRYIVCISFSLSVLYLGIIMGVFSNTIRSKQYFLNDKNTCIFWLYFILNEITTKTLLFHNYIITIFVFYKHNEEIDNFIEKIENQSNFILDTNNFLISLINDITTMKSKVERSIYYFNSLISVSTVFVCLAVFLFFDAIFRQNNELVDYLNASTLTIFYILVQCIFFVIIYRYAKKRTDLYQAVSGHNFIYKYIFTKTIHMNVEINRTNAILNWMILKDILGSDWIDFKIMGISSKDGDLIKKSIAVASLLIVIFSL